MLEIMSDSLQPHAWAVATSDSSCLTATWDNNFKMKNTLEESTPTNTQDWISNQEDRQVMTQSDLKRKKDF